MVKYENKRLVITGYTNNITCQKSFENITSCWFDSVCKVATSAEDHNGFDNMETLEILQDPEFKNEYVIVRGSNQDLDQYSSSDAYTGLFMNCGKDSLVHALRLLADKLEAHDE